MKTSPERLTKGSASGSLFEDAYQGAVFGNLSTRLRRAAPRLRHRPFAPNRSSQNATAGGAGLPGVQDGGGHQIPTDGVDPLLVLEAQFFLWRRTLQRRPFCQFLFLQRFLDRGMRQRKTKSSFLGPACTLVCYSEVAQTEILFRIVMKRVIAKRATKRDHPLFNLDVAIDVFSDDRALADYASPVPVTLLDNFNHKRVS